MTRFHIGQLGDRTFAATRRKRPGLVAKRIIENADQCRWLHRPRPPRAPPASDVIARFATAPANCMTLVEVSKLAVTVIGQSFRNQNEGPQLKYGPAKSMFRHGEGKC